jgi:hypothetical protein
VQSGQSETIDGVVTEIGIHQDRGFIAHDPTFMLRFYGWLA